MYLVLLVILILVVLGGLPQVSGSWHNMGYGPSGLGLLVVVVLIILLLGRW
ncbi:MAG TPA: DUF3309 family protein [Candidatus Dormibacteraeota bacterium]|nr:DUF3309 family protein [Candidatus Dormibacteraeota bacterium]